MALYLPRININFTEQNSLHLPWLHAQVICLHENTPSGGMVLLHYVTICVKWVSGTASKDLPFPFTRPFLKWWFHVSSSFFRMTLLLIFLRKQGSMLRQLPVAHHACAPYLAALWMNNVNLFMSSPSPDPTIPTDLRWFLLIPLFKLSHKMSHLCTNIVTFPG